MLDKNRPTLNFEENKSKKTSDCRSKIRKPTSDAKKKMTSFLEGSKVWTPNFCTKFDP